MRSKFSKWAKLLTLTLIWQTLSHLDRCNNYWLRTKWTRKKDCGAKVSILLKSSEKPSLTGIILNLILSSLICTWLKYLGHDKRLISSTFSTQIGKKDTIQESLVKFVTRLSRMPKLLRKRNRSNRSTHLTNFWHCMLHKKLRVHHCEIISRLSAKKSLPSMSAKI